MIRINSKSEAMPGERAIFNVRLNAVMSSGSPKKGWFRFNHHSKIGVRESKKPAINKATKILRRMHRSEFQFIFSEQH